MRFFTCCCYRSGTFWIWPPKTSSVMCVGGCGHKSHHCHSVLSSLHLSLPVMSCGTDLDGGGIWHSMALCFTMVIVLFGLGRKSNQRSKVEFWNLIITTTKNSIGHPVHKSLAVVVVVVRIGAVSLSHANFTNQRSWHLTQTQSLELGHTLGETNWNRNKKSNITWFTHILESHTHTGGSIEEKQADWNNDYMHQCVCNQTSKRTVTNHTAIPEVLRPLACMASLRWCRTVVLWLLKSLSVCVLIYCSIAQRGGFVRWRWRAIGGEISSKHLTTGQ